MKDIKILLEKPSVSIQEVELFESSTGYTFPKAYKNFISIHNAAYPLYNHVSFFNSYLQREDTRDVTFYGYGNDVEDYDLIEDAQYNDVYMPDSVVIFARAANGDYFCFDYRKDKNTNNPPIVVMYHDAYNEDNTKMYVDFVAKNFDEFMDSLYGFDDNDQKIVPD